MMLVCTCCSTTLTRVAELPLVRGTPRHGDLFCVPCGWLTPRELRDLALPTKEWCPTHGQRRGGERSA